MTSASPSPGPGPLVVNFNRTGIVRAVESPADHTAKRRHPAKVALLLTGH
jgi:hypothetical protein